VRATSCITEGLLASQGLSPFYLVCEYDICRGMSQRRQDFLTLICCARRHNKRNTLYLEFYVWDKRRNTSRSLCKVPFFVLNRFLTKIWSLSTNLSKILLCHTSRALFSVCWVVVCGQTDVQAHYCSVSYADQQNTGIRRITTFRSTTDRIYDGGPIIL